MRIAFVHIGDDLRLPVIMVRSARYWHPDAQIVHLADGKTRRVPGVDEVKRFPWDGEMMVFRLKAIASLDDSPTLHVDTDVVFRKNLDAVFKQDFDVALTRRNEVISKTTGENVAEVMPYNAGVMFSRSREFFEDALRCCEAQNEDLRHWYGDQVAIAMVAGWKKYRLLELPVDPYNYTPKSPEDGGHAYVIHYKGHRKEWMSFSEPARTAAA